MLNFPKYNKVSCFVKSAPHLCAFGAVFAHFYFGSGANERFPEVLIRLTLPQLAECLGFQITEAIVSVFVEAAGYYQAVPRNHARMPHFPTVVNKLVFDAIRAVSLLGVSGVFVYRRN